MHNNPDFWLLVRIRKFGKTRLPGHVQREVGVSALRRCASLSSLRPLPTVLPPAGCTHVALASSAQGHWCVQLFLPSLPFLVVNKETEFIVPSLSKSRPTPLTEERPAQPPPARGDEKKTRFLPLPSLVSHSTFKPQGFLPERCPSSKPTKLDYKRLKVFLINKNIATAKRRWDLINECYLTRTRCAIYGGLKDK